MSDTRTSFSYDPIRQGYDTNSWKTISGAPALSGSRLIVDAGTGIPGFAIHYADFLKGEISFDVNVPAAPGGDNRAFGVTSANSSSYIRFVIGDYFTCQTSEGGTTTTSSNIEWNSDWTGTNVIFKIRWEAGCAKFFINGSQIYAVSDSSVPSGPLSLYLYDNSSTAMSVGDLIVRGTQSFVMNPKTSDSSTPTFTGSIVRSESVTVTEAVTMFLPTLKPSLIFDAITVTENIAQFRYNPERPSFVQDITVTDVVTGMAVV